MKILLSQKPLMMIGTKDKKTSCLLILKITFVAKLANPGMAQETYLLDEVGS